MVVLRFLGSVFLLIAVIALVYDGTRALAGGGWTATSLYAHWLKLAPGSLEAAQAAVQRYTHPLLWDPVIRRVLLLPAWLVLGVLGVLLAYLGRRRRRVNVFSN
jgi:hypothetical protein